MAPELEKLGPMERLVAHLGKDSTEPELDVRVRTLIWSTALLAALALGWAIGHLSFGNLQLPALAGACLVGAAFAWVKLLRDRNLEFASHVVVGALSVAAIVGAYWTGGLRLTNTAPFLMVTVVAIMLLGRPGLVWCGLVLGAAMLFQVGHWLQYPFPDLVPQPARALDAAFTWISAALVILMFTASHDNSRRRLAARLQAASFAKSEFLANVSHELRNPVHALMAINAQLEAAPLEADQRELVLAAKRITGGLFTFLGDLVDLAAVERGAFQVVDDNFRMHGVLQEAMDVGRVLCEAKGLAFESTTEGDVEALLIGDRRRLRQVLTNLLGNAVRYTESGTVALRAEVLAAETEGVVMWRFAIEDTGIGVTLADRERIFEPGIRLTNEPDASGSGRGLPIVYELTASLGGTVSVSDRPDGGSRFVVDVPFGRAPMTAVEDTAELAADEQHKSLTVLVVDDEEMNRSILERMLDRLGQQVRVAADGQAALTVVAELEPDMILLDLRMPGWDGFTTIEKVRSHELEHGSSPSFVVALTGDATPEARRDALAAGADDVLFKPFELSDISTLVQRGLAMRSPSASDVPTT